MEGCKGDTDDREHSLFYCRGNNGVGLGILNGIRNFIPNLTIHALLRLELTCEEEKELPLLWTLAESLKTLWQVRVDKTKVSVEEIRTAVEGNWKILKET